MLLLIITSNEILEFLASKPSYIGTCISEYSLFTNNGTYIDRDMCNKYIVQLHTHTVHIIV